MVLYKLDSELESLVEKVANDLEYPKLLVRTIVFLSFKCVSETIRSAEKGNKSSFKSIRIEGLGLFRINKKKARFYFKEDQDICSQ